MDRGTDLCCWGTCEQQVPTPAMATALTKRSGQQCHCYRIERGAWGAVTPLLTHTWLPIARVSPRTDLRHGNTNTHRASVSWVPLLPSKGRKAYPWGMAAVHLWVNNPMKTHNKKMRAISQALAITSLYCSCLWWFGMLQRPLCFSCHPKGHWHKRMLGPLLLYLKTLNQIPVITNSSDSSETHLFLVSSLWNLACC